MKPDDRHDHRIMVTPTDTPCREDVRKGVVPTTTTWPGPLPYVVAERRYGRHDPAKDAMVVATATDEARADMALLVATTRGYVGATDSWRLLSSTRQDAALRLLGASVRQRGG